MEPVVRRALVADAAAIARVHVDAWRSTYRGIVPDAHLAALSYSDRESKWRTAIDEPNHWTFVAEIDGELVGFADCGPNRVAEPDYDGELYAIYVLAHHQGRGLGRRLVATACGALSGGGYRAMVVWVLERNPARDFYARLGGVRLRTKPIRIGGVELVEVAFGWPELAAGSSGHAPLPVS